MEKDLMGEGKLLVIIPAYNEQENIERTVESIIKLSLKNTDYLVIDDGSVDGTVDICEEKGFNYVSLPVNLGLAGAFRTGIAYAYTHGYDFLIQIDADGQHDPCYIQDMIECGKDCDIVIGSRFKNKKKPHTARVFGGNIISLLIFLTSMKRIKDPTSGMRLYNKKVIEVIHKSDFLKPEPDMLVYLIRSGFSIKEIQVEMHERIAGKSYLSFSKSLRYMFEICASILIVQWIRRKLIK